LVKLKNYINPPNYRISMNKQFLALALLIQALAVSHSSFAFRDQDSAARLKQELQEYSGRSAEDAIDQYEEDIDFDVNADRYLALAQNSRTYYNRRDIACKISTMLITRHVTTAIPVSASRPTV